MGTSTLSDVVQSSASFGKKLRDRRKSLGLTQVDLSRLTIDIASNTISQLERGTVRVRLDQLYQLANALRCSVALLMPDVTQSIPPAARVPVHIKVSPTDTQHTPLQTQSTPLDEKWQRVITSIKRYNPILWATLNDTVCTDYHDGLLKIQVNDPFSKIRVAEYRPMIEYVATSEFGKNITLYIYGGEAKEVSRPESSKTTVPGGRALKNTRACKQCGEQFMPVQPAQLYCQTCSPSRVACPACGEIFVHKMARTS